MTPEKILHEATKYMIEVAKWVEDVRKWREKQENGISTADADNGGSNPPLPPPNPPGTGG